jgi:putative ABC transport system permease protein
MTLALETAVIVTVDTIYTDFLFDNRNQNYTDVTVHPRNWMNLSELLNLTDTISKSIGVSKASAVYYVTSDFVQNQTGSPVDVLIYGINSRTHPDIPTLNVTRGFRTATNNTILISQPIATTLHIGLGSKLNIENKPEIGFKGADLTVGGIFTVPPFFGNRELLTVILIDIDTLVSLFEPTSLTTSLKAKIDVTVDNLLEIRSTSDHLKDILGSEFSVFAEKDISELQALGISAYSVAMNLVVMASLLVEFLFTTNMLAIVVRERQKEYGIFRTMGLKSTQLLLIIFYEVLIYSVIGSIFGILAGIGFSNILVGVLDQFYTSLEFQTIITKPSSLAVIFLSGVAVALLSGLYPTYLSIKVPVVQNIHSRMSTPSYNLIKDYWKYVVYTGALLTASGFFLSYFVGPARFLKFSLFSTHFFVIIFLFLGTLLIEAGLLIFMPRIGEKLFVMFDIVSRTISMRNISKEFQRSLFTIMTSSIALTFVIFVGVVSTAVIASVPQYYEGQWGTIDIVIETSDSNLLPVNFTDQLDSIEMIRQSGYLQETRTEVGRLNSYVFGVEPEQYSHFGEIIFDSISDAPADDLLSDNSLNQTNVLVSDLLYNSLNIALGQEVPLKYGKNNTINVTLAAVVKGNAFLGSGRYLYLASNNFQSLFNTSLAKIFICDVYEDQNVGEVRHNISETYEFLNHDDVVSIDLYRNIIENSLEFQANLFQVLFMESFILAGIAQFVGILLSTLQMEREMGIMRSMGLTKRGVFTIFLAESFALGFSAIIFGLFDGILGAALLLWYISFSIPIALHIPLDHIFTWLLISLAFTFVSTFIPAYRSSHKEVIATISARPMRTYKKEKKKRLIFPRFMQEEELLFPKYLKVLVNGLIVIYYFWVLIFAYWFFFEWFFPN